MRFCNKIFYFFFVCLLFVGATLTQAEEKRPNIVVILADDHGRGAISCYGSEIAKTPGIDRIAKEGMRMTHAVVTDSLCAPSRAVMISGKYNHLNSVRVNGPLFDGSQVTFPKVLQKAGYQTALVGKWHLGSQPTGFNYFSVIPGQGRFYDCAFKESGKEWKRGRSGGVVRKGYLTDVITDVAFEWLDGKRNKEQPFCLLIHHKAPHGPYDAAPRHKNFLKDVKLPEPKNLLDDYAGRVPSTMEEKIVFSRIALFGKYHGKPVEKKATGTRNEKTRFLYQSIFHGYLRLVAALDENVVRVLDGLEKRGLAENTLVIYLSDNGFFCGQHGFFNKMWMYDESLRIPMVVSWKGKIKPGSTCDKFVSMVDIAPTLIDVAGGKIPAEMQGQSFLPLLLDKEAKPLRDAAYYHYFAQYHTPESVGIRTKTHKLIHYPGVSEIPWEMFDLVKDPEEMKNLAGNPEYKKVQEELTEKLRAEAKKFKDNVAIPRVDH